MVAFRAFASRLISRHFVFSRRYLTPLHISDRNFVARMDSEDEIQKLVFSPIVKTPPAKGANKRLSVERIYQKKTQLEHILLRPDTYIGSVETVTQPMWVWEDDKMINREITYVPGLYKIFDEILVNAADNKQRDKNMSKIKITIDPEKNMISIWNDGKGIPVVEHKDEKLYVPELIFGHLLTSSNYDDDQKKVTGGRNGYGAKLCNIFSKKFTVETSSKDYKKKFKMSWSNNMGEAGKMKLASCDSKDYTCVTFMPDLQKFGMGSLDKDIVALMSRRAYDIAGTSKGVAVYLNDTRLPVKSFKDYVELYSKNLTDENNEPYKVVYDQVGTRWEICMTLSEKGFQQLSFVNRIATTKGGRHVDYVMDQVVKKLSEIVKKKNKGAKSGIDVKPYQIKNHCWVFVNCLIENPTFDSQTKENMTLQAKKFGSTCALSEKFLKGVSNSGIVDAIMNWVKFKVQTQMSKKMTGAKSSKLKGIPKLDDANDAGTRHSRDCTLILTEGDSAKTLAVSGLSVVGRDKYGVFPLKGKVLNVRDANHKQIMENAEINNIIKIMGLNYKKKYIEDSDMNSLRYGKLMIMTDQDHDGSHIKGLLINFIHTNWPKLLHQRVVEEFITPIVKVSKGGQVIPFYSLPEFEEWENSTENSKSWKVKYYKGLGTSTAKEAKEYFADMQRHRIPFRYSGPDDDGNIDLAFNKKRADDRKEWLSSFMSVRRQRREDGRAESDILYNANLKSITYSDFINKELILFSCADLERSVPSLVDGLKPGQRKVLYTCLKRNDKREVKVAQLAGSVAEMSAYHHGEASLMSTIINMCQNFVGSNNLNLLQPIGQFGTRLHGGKDAASPRYIFTMLNTLTRLLVPAVDDNVLKWCYDDNQRVEPEWYCPILPLVLINGTQGIGTGWSTSIPCHDVRDLDRNIRKMINGDEPEPLKISYKNFKGTIEEVDTNRYACFGEVSILDEEYIEITELPIKTWTQNYKESVLEPMFSGTEKVPAQILEYKEYNTDTTVRFKVKMSKEKLRTNENNLHKMFNLQTTMTFTNTLVMFDEYGCLQKFNTTVDILKWFFKIRMEKYRQRKDFLIGMLGAEAKKLTNQARFIMEKIDGVISILDKPKKELIKMLVDRGYDSDPVKAWKKSLQQETADDDEEDQGDDEKADFNYILNMPLWSLSREKKNELLKQRDAKRKELDDLSRKTPSKLWLDDLDTFMEAFKKLEQKEKEEANVTVAKSSKRGFKSKNPKAVKMEVMPSPHGIRVVPKVDIPVLKVKGEKKTKKKDPTVKKLDSYFKSEDGDEKVKIEKEQSILGADIDDDVDRPLSLVDRLNLKKKSEEKSQKMPDVKPATKQTKLNFKSAPKKKKKLPWESDSDDSDDNDIQAFDSTSEEESDQDLKKKPASKPKATENKPSIFDSDNDDSDNSDNDINKISKKVVIDLDDIDMDVTETAPKKKQENEEKSKKRRKLADIGSSDCDFLNTAPPKKQPKKSAAPKKPAPAKKALASKKGKKKNPWDDSDSGSEFSTKDGNKFDDDDDEPLPPKSTASKTSAPAKKAPAPKKGKKKNPWDDSDSGSEISANDGNKFDEDDDELPPDKSAPPKKPAASKKKAPAPKKGKKKNPWDSDSGSEFSASDNDADDKIDDEPPPLKRSTARRGAATAKKTYVVDSSDDDDDDSDF